MRFTTWIGHSIALNSGVLRSVLHINKTRDIWRMKRK
jgi:hypothetical protein